MSTGEAGDTHQVEMAVEGHERPHEDPAIQDGDPHAVVDVLQHLAAPRHRLRSRGEARQIAGSKRQRVLLCWWESGIGGHRPDVIVRMLTGGIPT